MKQPEDIKTVDIFNAEKRPRGRPRLEKSLTAAERQRASRLKRMAAVDGEVPLSLMISYEAKSAMQRLCHRNNCTRQQLIEKLLLSAQDEVIATLGATAQLTKYLGCDKSPK